MARLTPGLSLRHATTMYMEVDVSSLFPWSAIFGSASSSSTKSEQSLTSTV